MKKRSEARAMIARGQDNDNGKILDAEVEDISGKLRDELAVSAVGYEYPTVQKSRGTKALRPDLDAIVETVFVEDMHAEWRKLREGLRVGIKRSDHGTLQKALDNAEHNAHNAHRLMITAKIEMERWERENEVIFAAMWNDANKALQHEKDSGSRSKQITDADVRAKCASLYPDEWAAQEKKRRTVKLTVDSLENLAEMWASRCRSLQAMLGKLRG